MKAMQKIKTREWVTSHSACGSTIKSENDVCAVLQHCCEVDAWAPVTMRFAYLV